MCQRLSCFQIYQLPTYTMYHAIYNILVLHFFSSKTIQIKSAWKEWIYISTFPNQELHSNCPYLNSSQVKSRLVIIATISEPFSCCLVVCTCTGLPLTHLLAERGGSKCCPRLIKGKRHHIQNEKRNRMKMKWFEWRFTRKFIRR